MAPLRGAGAARRLRCAAAVGCVLQGVWVPPGYSTFSAGRVLRGYSLQVPCLAWLAVVQGDELPSTGV
jgi:hypothetical protein